uniref:Uncharacterized protein n=1 Tax=Peduovirinae sp. ctjOQ18 TaxID=2825161 RepID=A0A8S5P1M5_9CAUD|nr:MAG TPA: hypothetical protein [Peduovirinae sp. ctjOQ18]
MARLGLEIVSRWLIKFNFTTCLKFYSQKML